VILGSLVQHCFLGAFGLGVVFGLLGSSIRVGNPMGSSAKSRRWSGNVGFAARRVLATSFGFRPEEGRSPAVGLIMSIIGA